MYTRSTSHISLNTSSVSSPAAYTDAYVVAPVAFSSVIINLAWNSVMGTVLHGGQNRGDQVTASTVGRWRLA